MYETLEVERRNGVAGEAGAGNREHDPREHGVEGGAHAAQGDARRRPSRERHRPGERSEHRDDRKPGVRDPECGQDRVLEAALPEIAVMRQSYPLAEPSSFWMRVRTPPAPAQV